eukprot:m.208344 g.208344  ORF g.208344 m.208344 type:complete len:364 (+) comp15448_c0_seq22:435-1526(+)
MPSKCSWNRLQSSSTQLAQRSALFPADARSRTPAGDFIADRNLVKALPWFGTVRTKMSDPAYAGFFIPFATAALPNGTVPGANVPSCDTHYNPARCSHLYHDQVQTPQYPDGRGWLDGSCRAPCDCGAVPCGEYVFDHRNGSALTTWILDEYFGGSSGLGNPNIDGFMIDDQWLPQHGRNGSIPGGPSEMDRDAVRDMGLSQDDVRDIFEAWQSNMAAVIDLVSTRGGWTFSQLQAGQSTIPTSEAACAAQFQAACTPEGTASGQSGVSLYSLSDNHTNTAKVNNLAVFLLTRGPYAYIGHGWEGLCTADYSIPEEFAMDHGTPLNNCSETAPGSGIFTREWTKATVTVSCPTLSGSIRMKTP